VLETIENITGLGPVSLLVVLAVVLAVLAAAIQLAGRRR
jgi:hypothetical protein